MHPLPFREVGYTSAALLLTVGMALTGCSSSTSTSKPASTASPSASPTSSASSSSEPAGGTGATQAIEVNWAKFFSAKTPVAQRIALLQNGSQFSSIITSQAGSALATAASAKVTHVTLTGTNMASVGYNILLSGKPALSGQTGEAVYQDGVWKVGETSFCALLTLEAGGSTKGLPAGCKG
jgi:hypothetical protein